MGLLNSPRVRIGANYGILSEMPDKAAISRATALRFLEVLNDGLIQALRGADRKLLRLNDRRAVLNINPADMGRSQS